MIPRFILAVTDFSSHGGNALSRAALLSAEHGAALRLACIALPGDTLPPDAATRLAHHALQLSQAHGISAVSAPRLHRSIKDLRHEMAAADLVVWGTAPVKGLRAIFAGQPAEKLVRCIDRPLLVVQRSATHGYRKLLVAVDFTEASPALVDAAISVNKVASVELFHAVSTANEAKLRYAEVSPHLIETYREQCRRRAQDRMLSLTDSFHARRNRVQSTIAHGEPARQVLVQQERSGAELIVVGKHPASAFSEHFFSSVAGRLLRYADSKDGRSDILVVPNGWPRAALAAQRTAPSRVRAGAPEAPNWPSPAARRAA